jgi:alkylation response protein AidB-like acyl-CoA dehydrogenase
MGRRWKLHGQKWFCSHADADVAVLLARGAAPGTGAGLFALRTAGGWLTQQLPDRAAEGQARHALDGPGDHPDGATAYLVGDVRRASSR